MGPLRLREWFVVIAAVGFTQRPCSGVPLSSFYPYGSSAGDSNLPANDDGSTSRIGLATSFSYFGQSYSGLYVNNNGVISFNARVSSYFASAFPYSGSPLITPYWGDVDTRGTGSVWYRETNNNAVLQTAQNDVRAIYSNFQSFVPTRAFIATWHYVGYYSRRTDRLNTFQCILISDGTYSFVVFLYGDNLINWSVGQASSVHAQVGFNAGDGTRHYTVSGSRTSSIVNIETTSNIGVAGKYIFRVDDAVIATPPPETPPSISSSPSSTTVLTGSSPSFSCSAAGLPLPSISWLRGGSTISSGSHFSISSSSGSSTLRIFGVTLSDAGTYSCYASNSQGSQTSSFTITVQGAPTLSTSSTSLSVQIGASATMTCTATAGPLSTPYWQTGGSTVTANSRVSISNTQLDSTSVRSTLSITSLQSSDGGTYYCLAGNVQGSASVGFSLTVLVPLYVSIGTAVSGTLGSGSTSNYQFNFPSDGITIILNVGSGTINCYASDRYPFPTSSNYDWSISVSGYANVFIDPDLIGRTAGSYMYVALQGAQSYNTFTLNTASGDRRAPQVVSFDVDISNSLSQYQRLFYQFVFATNGITLRLTVSSGTIICYASDITQNPTAEQGYVWTVTTSSYIDVFLDPSTLNRNAGSTLYIALEGSSTSTNSFTISSSTGDRRRPSIISLAQGVSGSISSGELIYYRLPFPTAGVTLTLTVSYGRIICYASDSVQNPNGVQGYVWRVESTGTVEVFIDPNSLSTTPGVYLYIGLEGGSSSNGFGLGSSSGDRRTPLQIAVNGTSTDTVADGDRKFFQFPFPSYGVTLTLTVSTGYVICYASDRYANPSQTQGYDWRVEVSGYADVFLDPGLLSRTPGSIIYVAIEGSNNGASSTFTLGNTEGDRRIPTVLSTDTTATNTVGMGARVYYRFVFPSTGITIRLNVGTGYIVCYASDSNQNPNAVQGYNWRVETSGYIDTFIDPTLLGRPAGQYIYISLEGSQTTNSFSVNSTSGDRRVPSLVLVDVDISATVTLGELVYYRYSFSPNGLTIRLNIGSGYVICYASDTNQNPNSRQGYDWIVTVTGFTNVFIDPLLLGRQAGQYLYIGIEGGQSGSNSFLLNTTDGDRRVPTVVGLNSIGTGSVGTGVLQYFRFLFPTNGLTVFLNIGSGTVICYASDLVQNPNSRQTYIWQIQTSGYANVFLDPLLLGRSPGAYIYIGIEGVDGTNTFTVNNTDGDRREPISLNVGVVGTGSVDDGERLFYRFPYPAVGLTIRLTVTSGSVVCYASDRYRNPTDTQGYDWRVETDGYTDVYIDPELQSRSAGQYIYVAIEGLESDCDFSLNSTEGDRRVPFVGSLGVSVTGTLAYKEVVYYRFPFPNNGLTFVLEVSEGSVICYASNSQQNPGRKYGYVWRVEADAYNDSFVDPSTLQGTVGAYIYIGIDGRSVNSDNSFVLTATTGDTSTKVPNPPTNVLTTGNTATSATITWVVPVAAIVSPISGIQLYKLKVYEYQFNLATIYVNTTQLYYVFTNLEEYNNYSCEILAVNRVGEGQYGSPIDFSTLQAAPTGPPQGVSGTSASTTLITLEWSLPVSIHRNGIIVKYVVKVVEVYTGQIYDLLTENTHINVGPLHPYYIYECSIAAYTIATGVFSSPMNITTQETVPTGSPLNVTSADVGPRYVLLTWQPPRFDLQNGLIRQYLIRVIHNRTGLTYTVVSPTNQYRLQNLFPFTTYIFSIAAETVGLGPYSQQLTVTTMEAPPGSAPESVRGYVINSTSIFLGWEEPSEESLNGILRGYQINCSEVDTSALITVSIQNLMTETIVSNLHPAYTYDCRVSAVTVDAGVFSGNVTLEIDEAAPSGPPLNLRSTTALSRSVSLSWNLPLPGDRNGEITEYSVKVENIDTGVTSLFTTTETSYTVTSLTPYQNYEFSVAASTAIGRGPFSFSTSLRTPEDVPGAPQSPDSGKIPGSPNQLIVSWDPPTEPNGIIVSYKVYCFESLDESGSGENLSDEVASTMVASSSASETTVSRLTPYTYYSCYVTANTSIGEGDTSSSVRARTDESIPATSPQSLSAFALDANSLSVTWSDPDTPYGIIISYTVSYNITGVLTSFVTESQTVTLGSLDEYTVYVIYVAASTRIGTGPTAQVYQRTGQAKPHSPPTSIQVPSTDPSAATFSWQPPVPEDRNGIITHYVLILTNLDFSVDDVMANISGSLLSYTVTGLEEYSVHECIIAAGTVVGTGPYSSPIELMTMQDAPSAPPRRLTGSPQSTTLIDLSWDAPPAIEINGIIQYYSIRVQESESSRSWSFVHSENDTEITVGSLHPYYNYQCRVAAYTVGLGPYTEEFLVQTEEAVPTSAPLGLTADVIGTHSLTLSWELPPLENRNGRIRFYRIQVTGIEDGETIQETSTTTQITISNLHPYYNYDCSVAAETISTGPYSRNLSVQLDEYSPSAAPSNPTGMVIDSTSVSLTWDPPPVENRNGVIRKYIIMATETDTRSQYSWESVATNFEIHSLHPFYTYDFTIAAFTISQGPSTSAITLQTLHSTPSGTPEGVSVGDTLSTSFIVNWQPPASGNQNGIISGYTVKIVNLDTNNEILTFVTETSLLVSDLTPFTVYEISIAAHNDAGRGPFSVRITVETEESAPTSPPGDVAVSSLSSTVLQLSWSAPSAENSNGIIREYVVNLNEIDTGVLLSYTTATTSITLQSLHPAYTYECTVSAYTVATGPFSQMFTITMPEDAPSGFPQDFSATPTSSRSINLQWDAPQADEQNGVIIAYTITQTTVATGEVNQFSTNETDLLVTDLSPYTTYTWVIAASTAVGQGPISTTITLLTPEDAPTGAPQSISGTSTSSRSVYLTWNPPQASVQNGIIREYYIFVLEIESGFEFEYVTGSTEFEITELHPYYNYDIRVSAYTIALGPSSERFSVRTMEDAPSGPPVNIIVEPTDSRAISLQWSPPLPGEQNGLLVGYVVNVTSIARGERLYFQTTQLNLTVEGLTPHTYYECLIAAMTRIGTGPPSLITTVRTNEEAPGGSPSNTSGEALNSTHIALRWDPPSQNQTHGDIQEYRITIVETETGDISQYSSNITELIVGPLHPYYIYNCSIQAVTVEPGPPTVIIVRTEEGAPSSAPTSFDANVLSTTAISLSWDPPPPEHHNGIIRRYFIVLDTQDFSIKITAFTAETSIIIDNLSPYTVYSCTVAAETIVTGIESDAQVVQTFEAAPVVPPGDLSFVVLDSRSISLTWSAPREKDRNGVIRQYLINITEIDTGNTWQIAADDSNATVRSLHPFYSYSIIVAAETVTLGPFTRPIVVEMPEDAPSSPPTDVSTGVVTSNGFTLSWNYPPEVDWNGQIRQFMVAITEENTGQIFQLTASVNVIEVNFLHPFYTYSCSVAAVSVSTGPYSPPILVTTLTAVPTGPPQNIIAPVVEGTYLTLSWEPPIASEQNGIITGYDIKVTTETGAVFDYSTIDTTYIVSNLEPYTVYQFAIAALTTAGQGPFSTDMAIRTGEADPTASPDNVAVTAVGSTYAELSWIAPDSSSHNGVIRFYTVFVVEDETGTNVSLTSISTQITVTNLHPFYTYRISVAAVTVSPGPYSVQVTLTTLQDVPSASPREVEGEALSSSSFVLTWQPPQEDQLNGILTGFRVNVTETETGTQYQITTTTAQYTFEGLHPFYRYSFIVAAITVGTGPFSGIFTLQMPQDAPSAPPQNVDGMVFNSSSISISWIPPSFDSQNGIIVGYTIRIREIATSDVRTVETDGPHTEIFITSLHPYYVYEFSVAAQTIAVGPYSSRSTLQTDEDAPSASPRNVTATVLDSTTVELMWQPPPMDMLNGIIRQYSIDIYVSETRENIFKVMSDNSTSTVVTQLHPYYTYSFKVAAVTTAAGPQSVDVTVRTLESVPTGVPQSFEAVAVSSSSIRLTWIPPLAEEQNGMIRSYHINVSTVEDGSGDEEMMQFETDGLSTIFIVNNLHPYYIYRIHISAFTVGQGPSVSVEERTQPDVPTGAPQNLTMEALNSSTVRVSWDSPQPDLQNGPIVDYILIVTGLDTDEEYELHSGEDSSKIITVLGLHPFYVYTFSIAAVTTGSGPFTPAVDFQMPQEVCMASVNDVSVEIKSPSSVNISWFPPDIQFWNGIITSYTVVYELLGRADMDGVENTLAPISSQLFSIPQARMENNPDPRIASLPLLLESAIIDPLEEYYVYRFKMYLENAVGQSDISNSITVPMPPAVPSGPPTGVTVSTLSSTSIIITWDDPEEFGINGILTNFLLTITDSTGNTLPLISLPATTHSYQRESLKIYEVYNVEVIAQNAQGEGIPSELVSTRTFEDVPSAPVDVTIELFNATAVAVKWKPPVSPNGIILYYKITFYGHDNKDESEILDKIRSIAVAGNLSIVTDLVPGLTYKFEIRANTSVGYGEETTGEFPVPPIKIGGRIGGDDGSTPAIVVVAIVAFLALIILVIIVACLIFHRMRRNGKLKIRMPTERLSFANPNASNVGEDEEDGGIFLVSYKETSSNEAADGDSDTKEDLSSDTRQETGAHLLTGSSMHKTESV